MSINHGAVALFTDLPQVLLKYRVAVGVLAILICAGTWAIDLMELVYNCPFCRAQRTVIGLLGFLLLMPNLRFWLVRYLSVVFGIFGLVVGATQHFRGWARMNAGEFEWGDQWYINPWLLSGCAIFIITALLLLIWTERKGD
ncbi:hypothetical protein [uncultured Erythrobacter sp.]|uniref:hypothetical protein n=1 Tax=uncultured Erythrobacter sp. TaxID=263913 RepID=UPI0026263CCB|nr:hypothetical protein [uncultured Erythrobacter sp.]